MRAAGQVLSRAAWILAGVLLILGLVDYAIRHRRLEMTLRTTPQQEREDQRVMQGDPAGRAQRFRVARTWRGDSPDVLAGATLVLTGRAGLTLVLAGGPPPRLVSVRTSVKGQRGTTHPAFGGGKQHSRCRGPRPGESAGAPSRRRTRRSRPS